MCTYMLAQYVFLSEVCVCPVFKHLAHLVEAVGQRSEALHMGQSQQAAEEAVEGGLVLPLLLELLSQLKQALPPPVQHPQSQPEPAPPPIRAPPAGDERSSPRHSTEAPQVERNSYTQSERSKRNVKKKCSCCSSHKNRGARGEEGE